MRLADGPDSLSGRVELRQNGIWGTVCDDDFGPEEATVLDCIFYLDHQLLIFIFWKIRSSAEC